jgi:integrase
VKVFLQERKRKAPATYEQAYYSIQELLPFFESYSMKQVNDRSWAEYVEYQAQLKPDRLLRYDRRALLMMLHRLKAKGIVSEIPELPYTDEGPKRKRVLTPDEVKAIFTHATGTVYGLALYMYYMGPRPGEVLGSKWTEYDLKKGIWNIPAERTKTRTARSIKLSQPVLEWLKERQKIGASEFVFPGKDSRGKTPVDRYNKQWGRLMDLCGMSREITPYYLRHTFLSECAKKVRDGKLSLVLITKYAGTSIEQFEKTYLHVEGEDTKSVAELMELV